MKRIAVLAACLFFALCCSGCAPELYERLLIRAIGVDTCPAGCRVTVRAAAIEEAAPEDCFTGEGRTVPEAMEQIALVTGRMPLYSHNTLLLFGMDCAKEGLEPYLDFFIRRYESRPTVHTFLAASTAEEILTPQENGESIKTEQILNLRKSAEHTGLAVESDILRLIHGTYGEGFGAALPILHLAGGVQISETAVLHDLKLQCTLTGEETRGLLALSDNLRAGEAVIQDPICGDVSLNVQSTKAKITFTGTADAPRFSVELRVEGDVNGMEHSMETAETFLRLEKGLSETVVRWVDAYLQKAVYGAGADAAGLGNAIFRDASAEWDKVSSEWPEMLRSSVFDLSCEAVIRRVEK